MTSALMKVTDQHIAAREMCLDIPYATASKSASDRERDNNVWHACRASKQASRRQQGKNRAKRLQILTQNITGVLFLSSLTPLAIEILGKRCITSHVGLGVRCHLVSIVL